MSASEILSLAARAGVAPGVSVLDVCCGVAGPGRLITREPGCTYVGVDASASAIDIAREHAADLGCRFEVSQIPPVPAGPLTWSCCWRPCSPFPTSRPCYAKYPRRSCRADASPSPSRRATAHPGGTRMHAGGGHGVAHAAAGPAVLLGASRVARSLAGDCSRSHRATVDSLIEAFAAEASEIDAHLGRHAVDELLAAHRLWSHWIREGRVRKLAFVAEKAGTSQSRDVMNESHSWPGGAMACEAPAH